MRELESLDEQALQEKQVGSSSGPCITHNDIWHPKCQNHECCIGHHATTCKADGFDPPEYQHPETDYLLELFEEYERNLPE